MIGGDKGHLGIGNDKSCQDVKQLARGSRNAI